MSSVVHNIVFDCGRPVSARTVWAVLADPEANEFCVLRMGASEHSTSVEGESSSDLKMGGR